MEGPLRPGWHLDATAGREVAYCHQCNHEWYRDEHDLTCPVCGSEITEIVSPGEDDPRGLSGGIEDTFDNLRRFDRSPHPYHRHGRNQPDVDSDPEEGDIGQHTRRRPGSYFIPNIFDPHAARRQRPQNQNEPEDPTEPAAMLARLQEMLASDDFHVGATGRSGRAALFPSPPGQAGGPPTIFQQTRTYSNEADGRGGVEMSFSFGVGNAPANPISQLFETLGRAASPPPGSGPPPGAEEGDNRDPNTRTGDDLASLFRIVWGAAVAPNGVQGDGVYTQEAMDRILSQLMEQHQSSNAAPPASQQTMDSLDRKKLDTEMLPEGKGECTICIQEVKIGEEVVVLPCAHWFHEECILHWLREHRTCPVCRQSVEAGRQRSQAPSPSPGPGPSRNRGPNPGQSPGAAPETRPGQPRRQGFFSWSSQNQPQRQRSTQSPSQSQSPSSANPGPPPSYRTGGTRAMRQEAGEARLNAIRRAADSRTTATEFRPQSGERTRLRPSRSLSPHAADRGERPPACTIPDLDNARGPSSGHEGTFPGSNLDRQPRRRDSRAANSRDTRRDSNYGRLEQPGTGTPSERRRMPDRGDIRNRRVMHFRNTQASGGNSGSGDGNQDGNQSGSQGGSQGGNGNRMPENIDNENGNGSPIIDWLRNQLQGRWN